MQKRMPQIERYEHPFKCQFLLIPAEQLGDLRCGLIEHSRRPATIARVKQRRDAPKLLSSL